MQFGKKKLLVERLRPFLVKVLKSILHIVKSSLEVTKSFFILHFLSLIHCKNHKKPLFKISFVKYNIGSLYVLLS